VTALWALGPGFDPAVVAAIDGKLSALGEIEQVDVLFLVESGSRAGASHRPTAITTVASSMSAGPTTIWRCSHHAT